MRQAFFYSVLLALILYAYYRLAKWLAGRCRNPRRLRYWWPSLMVALCSLSVLAENLPGDFLKEDISNVVMLAGAFLNLPIAPVFCLDGILVDRLNLGGWSTDALIAASIWAGWYGVIRLLESRSVCAILKTP